MTHKAQHQILAVLREAGDFISGEKLSEYLNISRTAVWKHITQLRVLGYQLDSLPRRGYRLVSCPNAPIQTEVLHRLKTKTLGRPFLFFSEASSTNQIASEKAAEGAPEGTTVVADRQTRGRGRLSRTWHSPPGVNLYVSLVLRPRCHPGRTVQVPLIAGLALVRALSSMDPGLPLAIKWPNDVFLAGKKAAGVLCDMHAEMDRVHHVILGVGVNVNMPINDLPPELRESAATLKAHTREEMSRPQILAELLNHLEPLYEQWQRHGLAPFLDEWEEVSMLRGRSVTVSSLGEKTEGVVRGITEDGALILERPNAGTEMVLSGDVHLENY